MSCSPFDLRDYFFGELPESDRRQTDLHIKSCGSCREELDQLRSTQTALLAIPDEEIPQRIGFVSDRVYEPSAVRRWLRAFWGSAPKLGFASAAMLSAALLVSATHRPVAAPLPADFARQVNEVVAKAVAESDVRHQQQTAKLLEAAAQRFDAQLKVERQLVSQDLEIMAKYDAMNYRTVAFPWRFPVKPLIVFALTATLLAAPGLKRTELIAMEKSFDQRIRQLTDDPYVLVGFTRGVYLEGYGAVFTAEVNLANGPRPGPFQPTIPKEAIAKLRKLKLERLPALRQSMREMLMAAASSLDGVPAKEQIVVGASLLYFAEEDTSGLPGQILMQGERGKLIDAKLGRIPLDTVVKVREF